MYLMLTERCQLRCEHCGFACTDKGRDMSWRVFKAALKWYGGDYVTLGGGEPTLHPRFWQMLAHSIACCDGVWLATNGQRTEDAIALARMAQKGVIGVRLSMTQFHKRPDESVVRAFTKDVKRWDYLHDRGPSDSREIVDLQKEVVPVGRAKHLNPGRVEIGTHCLCEGPLVLPDGKIKWCGCEDAPVIGDVWDDVAQDTMCDHSDNPCWSSHQRSSGVITRSLVDDDEGDVQWNGSRVDVVDAVSPL